MSDSFSPGFLWWLFLAIFSPLVAVGLYHAVVAAVPCYAGYLWLAVGVVAFFLIDKLLVKGNDDSIRVFSHELNHAVVSLMLFKKVHSFHVESDHGVIYRTAGGRFSSVLISLAPYCLPLFSYALLIIRAVMISQFYWIVDILLGITVGFYFAVFKQQTGSHETDINQFRFIFFPYWYIFTFLAFNASIILLSLLPDKNVFLAFADTFVGYWHNIVDVFSVLFLKK